MKPGILIFVEPVVTVVPAKIVDHRHFAKRREERPHLNCGISRRLGETFDGKHNPTATTASANYFHFIPTPLKAIP